MEAIVFLVYVLLAMMNAMIADRKNISVLWVFVVSIFLTPVIPYLYLLAIPVQEEEKNNETRKAKVL